MDDSQNTSADQFLEKAEHGVNEAGRHGATVTGGDKYAAEFAIYSPGSGARLSLGLAISLDWRLSLAITLLLFNKCEAIGKKD